MALRLSVHHYVQLNVLAVENPEVMAYPPCKDGASLRGSGLVFMLVVGPFQSNKFHAKLAFGYRQFERLNPCRNDNGD